MTKQKKKLEKDFENWKRSYEQIEDVILLAIKQ